MTGRQPHWRHISDLPVFTDLVDGLLASAMEQLTSLRACENRPAALDDHTLNRFRVLHTEQREDHGLFEQQFERWMKGPLTDKQATEINRLIVQSEKLKATNEKILVLVEKIAPQTIDSIMAMDDYELGQKVLSGELKRPRSNLTPTDFRPSSESSTETKSLTDAGKQRLAERIHKRVTKIVKKGGDDVDILAGTVDFMDSFKSLIDTTSESDMQTLYQRFDGFYRFVSVLDTLARGIESGDIPVP